MGQWRPRLARRHPLGIRVELCPDGDGDGPWIEYDTFTEDVIEPLDLYGVLLRSQVVRIGDPVKAPTGGILKRWRRTPAIAPANQGMGLHVAVRGPLGSASGRWGVSYPNPERAIRP